MSHFTSFYIEGTEHIFFIKRYSDQDDNFILKKRVWSLTVNPDGSHKWEHRTPGKVPLGTPKTNVRHETEHKNESELYGRNLNQDKII